MTIGTERGGRDVGRERGRVREVVCKGWNEGDYVRGDVREGWYERGIV